MELFHTVIQTNKDMKENEVSVFVQHIAHVSVFSSLWQPDLIWFAQTFYRIGFTESSNLIKIWRKTKFRHFIQHLVCVSVFTSLWWPNLIWLGSIFHGTGSIKSSKLIKMWRKTRCRCYSSYCVCISFYKPLAARSHLIVIVFLLHWPHRLIQTAGDVTKNKVPAFHST